MPKRRYLNAKAMLERIWAADRKLALRQQELLEELDGVIERRALLADRADLLTAYDWQSRHHFPLVAEMAQP